MNTFDLINSLVGKWIMTPDSNWHKVELIAGTHGNSPGFRTVSGHIVNLVYVEPSILEIYRRNMMTDEEYQKWQTPATKTASL